MLDDTHLGFRTKPEDAISSGSFVNKELDFSKYYEVSLNNVNNLTSTKSGNPYYKIEWDFIDPMTGKKSVIYDIYVESPKTGWRISQFENLYRLGWEVPKNADVQGKIAHAKLKIGIYEKDGEKKEKYEIVDIKEWYADRTRLKQKMAEKVAKQSTEDDAIPF